MDEMYINEAIWKLRVNYEAQMKESIRFSRTSSEATSEETNRRENLQ